MYTLCIEVLGRPLLCPVWVSAAPHPPPVGPVGPRGGAPVRGRRTGPAAALLHLHHALRRVHERRVHRAGLPGVGARGGRARERGSAPKGGRHSTILVYIYLYTY